MPYIVIAVVSDHTAPPRIVEKMLAGQLPDHSRMVGLFEYPNRPELKCSGSCVRKGMSSWSRHAKGFMYCNICGSRNKRLRRWLVGHLFDLLGANLYENAPAAFRTPEGYGS